MARLLADIIKALRSIRLRARNWTFWVAFTIAAGLTGLVVAAIARAELDRDNPWSVYPSSNIISFFVVEFLLAPVALLWKSKSHFAVPLPMITDGREIFSRRKLDSEFRSDETCGLTSEWGWIMRGDENNPSSAIRYCRGLQPPIAVTAEFLAVRRRLKERHFRCGMTFLRNGGSRAAQVHFSSENLLVGYTEHHSNPSLSVLLPVDLTDQFFRLSLMASDPLEGGKECDIYCQVDEFTFLIARVAIGETPWELQINAWSDDKKHHTIRVRDISIVERRPD